MMFLGPASAIAQIDAADLRRAARFLSEPSREAPINPSIVVIVVILTIIFFLSGCLHLLIRCLVRAPRRDPNSIVTLTAMQGQLQQLFHLHDSGVEQAFIDTLPVFFYKSVKGLKEGADCAVCLCEFQGEDRLRLLPKCSHAFHLDCIDTWLLSHSTCPLCRRSLLPEESPLSAPGHSLLLDSSRSSDGVAAEAPVHGRGASESGRAAQAPAEEPSVHVRRGSDLGAAAVGVSLRMAKAADQDARGASVAFPQEHAQSQYAGQVLPVQLGRFRVVAGNASADASASMNGSRRSYSVGSYEYVLDPSNLEVVIAPTPHRRRTSTPRRPTPGHRTTLSECNPEDILPDPVVTPFVEDGLFFARPAAFEAGAGRRAQAEEEGELDGSGWVSVELGPAQSDDSALKTGPSTVAAAASETSAVSALTTSCSSSSRRAFSFRHLPNSEVAKLKASASRRSVSETELPALADVDDDHAQDDGQTPHHPDHDHLPAGHLDTAISFSGAQLVSASTQLSNYDVPRAGGRGLHQHSGLARRTISWLVGKPYKWKPPSLSTYMNAGHR